MYILEAGQKFERYHIIRQLGQGVAGISYEAEDKKRKDKVVLKLIHPWLDLSYTARRQFFRDMQALSVLTHTFLAPVLNYGEVAGQLYVVRWYAKNGSLLGNEGRAWFTPPLDMRNAFTYIYQLSQALHLIHGYNYTHGALTFSNILILEQSRTESDRAPLLLSDAGLAQFVRRFGQPQQRMLPMTAAPEQFKGQVTPASDQYALAILLSVWLTGRPPFAGSPAEIEQFKLTGVIPALYAGLTGEQEGIIRRALSAKQEARYPSILAFAEALMASLQSVHPQMERAKIIEDDRHQEEPMPTKQISRSTAGEQEQPAQPLPPIEPDVPQPRPAPQPIPEPQPETAPVPPAPEPEVEPVIIPTPAPDIPQPIPEQTPFPPEPLQPYSPQREAESPSQEMKSRYTEPLSYVAEVDTVPTAYLIITSPFPREPRKIPLLKDEINLGRAGSSDILLDEDTITSRHHAQVKREGEHYIIYDKRSTYGVTVNEQKLEEGIGQVLKEGDHIQIGDYSLLFSLQLTKDSDEARIEHALL